MGREHVVEVVGLEVVLEAAVARAGREEEVDAVPEEGEGRGEAEQRGQDARKVVEVLDGVHAEAGEGLDVRVAVVQRVHEGEEWLAV